MTDEEKNVIDLLKNIDKQKCLLLNCPVVKNNIERQLKIIELNRIIRKQQKEIEELKNGQIDFWISDKEIEERIRNKFVSKDKLIELREIDSIDLIQCKLRKLLEE